ncbi:MAG: sel1 repeat family protein [Gammaproteobacteria bacterium]|nr:sel1 repeat family protein [Gammaproteobacteria bacterium]
MRKKYVFGFLFLLLGCLLFAVVVYLRELSLPFSQKVDKALRANDLALAESLLEEEIQNYNPEAQAILAWLILNRRTPSTVTLEDSEETFDFLETEALPLLEEAASANDPLGQYLLAKKIKRTSRSKKAQQKKFNELMQSAAQQNFAPALVHLVYNRPLVRYGKEHDEYLLIDLSSYPLQSSVQKNIDCTFKDKDSLPYISDKYSSSLRSRLQGKSEEYAELIKNAAQCLFRDINTITQRLQSGVSDTEGKILFKSLFFANYSSFFDESKIFQNPEVLLALGDMFDAIDVVNWGNIDFNNLNPNVYETGVQAKRADFYYRAVMNARKLPQFAHVAEQAHDKLQKLANMGSASAQKKITQLLSGDSQLSSQDKIEKMLILANKGSVSAMRDLGIAYLAQNNKEEATKWLQFAAYSNDNKSMALLSDVWEASDNSDEKVLGALWGQLVVQLGSDEKHDDLYVSESSLEMQDIYTFLFSLKPDARGKTIPDKFAVGRLSLYANRAVKRQQQQEKYQQEQDNTGGTEIQSLLRKVEQGDSSAMMTLGKRYYEGDGVDKDKAKAFQLYQRAQKTNYDYETHDIFKVLTQYDEDIKLIVKKQKLLLAEYDKKARAGNIDAINYLINAYSTGVNAPYNPEKAQKYQQMIDRMRSKMLL